MPFEAILSVLGSGCCGLLFLVAFVAAIGLVVAKLPQLAQGMPSGSAQTGGAQVDLETLWRGLADRLDIDLQVVDKPADSKVVQGGGVLLRGEYGGLPIEIRYLHSTEMDYGHSLTHNRMTWTVDTQVILDAPGGGWQIGVSDPAVQRTPTGVPTFDAHLRYLGPQGALSTAQLEALGRCGWMNLAHTDDRLVLTDDWVTWYSNLHGPMKLLQAVHPLWGMTAAGKPIDLDRAVAFIDLLVSIARRGVAR